MTEEEYQDLVKLYGLDTRRPSQLAAYRVHVLGENGAEAARNAEVNYHTAIHSIKDVALKYQIYLTVKNGILARSKS